MRFKRTKVVVISLLLASVVGGAFQVFAADSKSTATDLGLKFNQTVVTSGDVYSYPSDRDKYTVNISTVDPTAVIKSVSTSDKTVEPNIRSKSFDLNLDMKEKRAFHVVVESTRNQSTKDYDVTVMRLSNDLTSDISVTLPDGFKYPAKDDGTGNLVIQVPIAATDCRLDISMFDPNAQIVQVGLSPINKNKYEESLALTEGSEVVRQVTVSPEDTTVQKKFNITITNKEVAPSVRITNKADVNNVTFGLSGILKGNKFIKYGNDITSLRIAQLAGRTNGIAIEVEVSDPNPGQYLRGYIEIPGSNMKYLARWGSFDGPTVTEAKEGLKGYVYIDRSAMRSDMKIADVELVVSDYANALEDAPVLNTSRDKMRFAIDITAPTISAAINEKDESATVSVTDTTSGFSQAFYRISTDNGRTWNPKNPQSPGTSTVNKIPATAKIDLARKGGDVLVEITAYDNVMNKSTATARLKIEDDFDTAITDAKIHAVTNRVADIVFVNTRKNNTGSLSQQTLDTFY